MLFGDLGLLGRIHAADGRAVGLPALLVGPGTAALDPCDGFGSDLSGVFLGHSELVLHDGGGYRDVSVERSCRTLEPLILESGDHVGEPAVSVLGSVLGVPYLESGGDDDGTDVQLDDLVLLVVVDGLLSADLGAYSALAVEEHLTLRSINKGDPGHSLGVGDVDCPPGGKPVLELVRDSPGGTLGDTVTASGTGFGIYVPCFLQDLDGEVSGLSEDLLDLMVGQNGHVRVSGAVCHLRRQDTRRAIVGRESLVKHAHRSADGGEFVHHIDVDVPVCKVQSSLDSGDSSADH